MSDELNGNAVPTSLSVEAPASEPATETPVPASEPAATPANGSPFDASALEAKLKQKFGDDFSINDFDTKFDAILAKKIQSHDSRVGREFAEYKKANEPKEQFWKMVESNDTLREELAQVMDRHISTQGEAGGAPTFQSLALEQRLAQLEMSNLEARTNQEIAQLESRGWPVDESMRDEIYSAVLESGGKVKPEGVYLMKYGPILIEHERKRAAEEAIAALKINNGTYTPVPAQRGQAAPSKAPVDVTKMTNDEWARYASQRWANPSSR